ncbi:MAG TPA: tetratricopeptide repeat protein, partial [Myxococcota bacterium]|nr:tetratricopeptide repeat protein [Myxococcota bacterium]
MAAARLLLLVVIAAFAAAGRAAAQPAGGILVLPFENTQREPRGGWLGEAAAILVADELMARGLPAITRTERVRAYERLQLPVSASLSRATVIKVGEVLGASEVIGGSYRLDGDELIVEAHSIRIDVGRLQPHVQERGGLTELFGVFERLAERLASGTPRVSGPLSTPPLAAFESYVKGLLAESVALQATFLEAAIRDYPAFDRARLALWQVRYEQADHGAALAAVRDMTGDSFIARRAQLRAGVSLLEMKAYPEADGRFKALIDPAILETTAPAPRQYAPILNNLGIVQLRRGPTAESGSAAYYLTRAADADPANPDYQFNLGYAYVLDGNHQAALFWLREALRREVTDADAHYLLAVALQATDNGIEAARERELARQLSSRYEELEKRSGAGRMPVPPGLERLRLDLDGPGTARPDPVMVSAAQREQRDLAAFHLERGQALIEDEQDREALAELRRAVYLSPYAAAAHLLIGRIHLRAGRPAEAVDALKIAIWSEDSAAARIVLAEAYLAMKSVAAARDELTRALAIDPEAEE